MRKYLLLFLFIVFMCGCGEESENTGPRHTLSSEEIQELKEKYPVLNKESEIEKEIVESEETKGLDEEEQPDVVWKSWAVALDTYPVVSYDEIKSGKYNGQYVLLNFWVDEVSEIEGLENLGIVSDTFAVAYYQTSNGEFAKDESFIISWDSIIDKKFEVSSGDELQMLVYVENTSDFGFWNIRNLRKIDSSLSK